jgi:hypothetical protein
MSCASNYWSLLNSLRLLRFAHNDNTSIRNVIASSDSDEAILYNFSLRIAGLVPIQYINRKCKIYYVHQGKTKTGKPKYYLFMKNEGNLVNIMPPKFEIYENPINAHVILRRRLPKLITDGEVNIVEQGIKKLTKLDYYS